MYLLNHVAPEVYLQKWQHFDGLCKDLEDANMGLTPFDRNAAWREWTSDEYFHEWPVPIRHFVRDPYYVGTDVLIRDTIEDFLGDFLDVEQIYELFVFIAGIGSGKSFSASIVLEYMLYVLSTMRDPHRYLNGFPGVQLSPGTEIVFINASAAGATQGKKIVYGDVYTKITSSPYFMQRFQPYPGKSSELLFPHRIRMSPSTSKAQSVLGFNLFCFVLDEAAFGVETEKTNYVKELFLALNQRRKSRFGRLGCGGLFTSPGSEHGFVEMLAGEGVDWDTSILVRRITTWDAKGEVKPGAHVFLFDKHPDMIRILGTDYTFVADNRAEGGDLIVQTANGEVVRVRNREPEQETEHAAPAAA